MANYEPVQLAFDLLEPADTASLENIPVIFMHGLAETKEYWNDIPQIVANATKRKVYSIDSRNHGDSEWSDVFNFDCTVCDLLNFMDIINAPKAILVGHSMGGATGIKTALQRPERVEKLIVEDMTVGRVSQPMLDLAVIFLTLLQTAVQQVPPSLDEEAAKKMVADFVYNYLPPAVRYLMSRASIDGRIKLKRTSNGQYAFKSNCDAIIKGVKNTVALMTDHTGVYEGPTTFIYGKLSSYHIGNTEAQIKQFFPKAELIGIENAGHTIHADFPKEFTEALLKSLAN